MSLIGWLEDRMDDGAWNTNEIKYLKWDSEFFGFSIGRIHAQSCSEGCLRKTLERAGKEKIEFIELFCAASDSESIIASEGSDFHLADVRLIFKKKLTGDTKGDQAGKALVFSKAGNDDISRLKIAGRGLFSSSRYYLYPEFDRNKVDLMFQLWIEKAVLGEFDDELYYLCAEPDILAFISLRYQEHAASIGLLGVKEAYWGRGLGTLLLDRLCQLLHKRQVTEVTVATQGKNLNAVQFYQKNEFHLSKITLCYYKWMGF